MSGHGIVHRNSKAWSAERDSRLLMKDCPEDAFKSSQEFKADAGKPNPTLLEKGCPKAIAVVQATLDYGNLKYEAHSWKKVPDGVERYDAAARRHRNLRDQGETHDVESWLPHIAHEIINNLFLLEMMIEADPGCQWKTFNPNPPQSHKEKPSDTPQ